MDGSMRDARTFRDPFIETAVTATFTGTNALRFDWLMSILTTWLVAGFYIDGWAHNTHPDLETFYTPWHGVMYSGFLATALVLGSIFAYRAGRGTLWSRAMPAGYGLSLAGVAVFMAGGIGDLIWHELFGIEQSVSALLSPTHLMLATGIVLILTGPLRSTAMRPGPLGGWRNGFPALLAAAYTLSALTYMTQFIHPLGRTGAARDYRDGIARVSASLEIGGILLQSAILAGLFLLLVQRWRLPFGSVALLLGLNATLMSAMCYQTQAPGPLPLVGAALLTGLAGDLLLATLQPSADRVWALRAFAALVPSIWIALYFVVLVIFGGGIWWTVHLWTGTIVLAGVAGLYVSLLAAPPRSMRPVEASSGRHDASEW
jgi:hypothetical protein